MQHQLRLGLVEHLHQVGQVPHVADDAGHAVLHTRQREQIGLGGGLQRVARQNRPGVHQDPAHPRALKPGVAGDQHPLTFIEAQVHQSAHTFQGACPVAHIFSRVSFSRTVSMHCQKPLCL